jgi:hypothetical protein
MNAVFEVFPVDSKGRVIGRPTYVRAATRDRAERAGRRWLTLIGWRGSFKTRARIYNPLTDPEMARYVKPIIGDKK